MSKLKVGIFFGGPSREREISFAGGRTVYDNLDKSLFEPVPIFVDSRKSFIKLDWPYVYKGTIRDFFPPVAFLPPSPHGFQVYAESLPDADPQELAQAVGQALRPDELPALMDLAFLALHGEFGEDGQIQGLLESLGIPYTGSGLRASSIGMDKAFQKKLMAAAGFAMPPVRSIARQEWQNGDAAAIFADTLARTGWPVVIRPANQGSSIGVRILPEAAGLPGFAEAVEQAFFSKTLRAEQWLGLSPSERVEWVRQQADLRDGLGLPLRIDGGGWVHHPEALLDALDAHFAEGQASAFLESYWAEQRVVAEGFIAGKEFSCIVLRLEDGTCSALPPTEIVKGSEVFDYRSKYLPGLSRKVTPIDLPTPAIEQIRSECERLFELFEFNTYARIDGFYTPDGRVLLNDPNTTSGMLPSSFFFHQAAEIGLTPSQFLTYIIRSSLLERQRTDTLLRPYGQMLERLTQGIAEGRAAAGNKQKIAVVLGGYSFERHISVESGRNVFEKLASSDKYEPLPVFLLGNSQSFELYQIPINLLLKDNADDIRDKILHFSRHEVVGRIMQACAGITRRYASADVVFAPQRLSLDELARRVDGVFIALHGRPGEDGTLQAELERVGLPYNGSDPASSAITIHKYETLQRLKAAGFAVAEQFLGDKTAYRANPQAFVAELEARFAYPFIAKPVDDGCSSAVKKIKDRAQLAAYLEALFRDAEDLSAAQRQALEIKHNEEFPQKAQVLVEELIGPAGAAHFLEITGGLMTHHGPDGPRYEVFEPSEALASGEVLSLEEKFLAGEGQNITPARFARSAEAYGRIAAQVKADLQRAAEILGVQGYARIDAFVRIFADGRVETLVIEVNSLPGMTPATCIFHQAAINGYKPYEFIDRILAYGFGRAGKAGQG